MHTLLLRAGLLLAVLGIVISCREAVTKMEPEPEPEPPEAVLTLQGTWIHHATWTDDVGTMISGVTVLTQV